VRALTVLVLLLACAPSAFARAGGGHSFGGGSRSRSSGGSSLLSGLFGRQTGETSATYTRYYDDSDYRYERERSRYQRRYRRRRYYGSADDFTFDLFFLIPIFIVGVVHSFRLGRWGSNAYADYQIRQHRDRLPGETAVLASEQVKKAVPDFDQARFLAFAREAFLAVQSAWTEGDMAAAREWLTDDLRERLQIQLTLLRMRGLRNVVTGVRVIDATIVGSEASGGLEAVDVAFQASAFDRTVALADGRAAQTGGAQEFAEVWSFLRRDGTWRVSEMTQPAERTPRGGTPPSGAGPDVCAQALEDRASLLFWKWRLASALQDARSLFPEWTPAAIAAFQPMLAQEPAVGGARLLCYERAKPDRAHVEVKWSCLTPEGPAQLRHVVTMVKEGERWLGERISPASHWRTQAEAASFAWADPLSSADVVALMASAIFADGRATDQELAALNRFADSRGIAPDSVRLTLDAARQGRLETPKPASGEQAEAMLKGLIRSSLADYTLSDQEVGLLDDFARKLGLAPNQLEQMIAEERKDLYARARA
jgi:hypothetical protein